MTIPTTSAPPLVLRDFFPLTFTWPHGRGCLCHFTEFQRGEVTNPRSRRVSGQPPGPGPRSSLQCLQEWDPLRCTVLLCPMGTGKEGTTRLGRLHEWFQVSHTKSQFPSQFSAIIRLKENKTRWFGNFFFWFSFCGAKNRLWGWG